MLSKYSKAVSLIATLLVPFGLLHAFVLAEICIGITDALFALEMLRQTSFSWTKKKWFIFAILWWVWLLFCSTPLPLSGFGVAGWRISFAGALVVIRLLVFALALQSWVLTTARAQRLLWLMLALSCLWIGVECWQQYLTGKNIFGNHRWPDGALTGPFWKPRAGALFGHLIFVALLPPVLWLHNRPEIWLRVGGYALVILGVVTSVLIGQRMGVVDTLLGLVLLALLVAPLRRATIFAVIAGSAVLLATPIIAPSTHAKLVGETSRQISHFTESPYGELWTRATTMGLASPWHGWGYNGFRVNCPQERFASGLPALGIAPTTIELGSCNLHPHNYYLQAFTDAGVPGLILFTLMNLALVGASFPGWGRGQEPLRIASFIGVFTFTWPFGSTDEFPTLYILGWMFLLTGLALAPDRIAEAPIKDAA